MFGLSQGLILGKSGPWPFFPNVRLPHAQRAGHVYVIGKTGKGKSKFLLSCLLQDIADGRGCGLIDPHSDLVADLLAALHEKDLLRRLVRERKLIYLNPADHRYVVPFNVLAMSELHYEVAQNVVEAFRRTWSETLSEAPQFSNLMLHALLVLLKVQEPLTVLPRLLLDRAYRERLLKEAADYDLSDYFHHRYDAWGKQQGALMRESTLNKVTALTLNPHLNAMLGESENHLDLRQIMDEGKILIADLGQCDEESRRLLGNLLTTGFEQAALSRHALTPEQRRPFYLYLDEFHTFSANEGSSRTLANILTSARKFGLHLTLAHQYLGQLSPRMRAAVWGNTWTKIVFGISEADAQELAQLISLGSINTKAVKHDPPTEAQHPLYEPLLEQWNEWAAALANQKPREATVRNDQGKILKIWALSHNPTAQDSAAIDRLLIAAMKQYGRRERPTDPPTRAIKGRPHEPGWPYYDRD